MPQFNPTATTTNPERFYSLSLTDDMGRNDNSSRSYLLGLMKISGKRLIEGHELLKAQDPIEGSKRIELARKIESNLIPESDLFYLKRYIETYYPDFKGQYDFHPILS